MNGKNKNIGLRTAAVIVVVLILIVGGISITRAAAQSAIPGDALYPVKTTIEDARLTLAQDAGSRAEMKMAFAEQRLQEVEALIAEGRYFQISNAVLEFEAYINGAILELGTIAEVDPSRAAELALDITSALSRYAQTLTVMAASAPEAVRADVARALDTTLIAGSLGLPAAGSNTGDDNGNANTNDDNGNANTNDDNGNVNTNDDNGNDDNGNANDDNGNVNTNDDNGNDDSGNANDDNGNVNTNDDNGNDDNDNDDNGNANDDDGNGDD